MELMISPSSSMNDIGDCFPAYIIPSRQIQLGNTTMLVDAAHLVSNLSAQLCTGHEGVGPTSVAPIVTVVQMGSGIDMCRVATRWIVARVTGDPVAKRLIVRQLPSDTRRIQVLVVNPESTITTWTPVRHPWPARIRTATLVNPAPESGDDCGLAERAPALLRAILSPLNSGPGLMKRISAMFTRHVWSKLWRISLRCVLAGTATVFSRLNSIRVNPVRLFTLMTDAIRSMLGVHFWDLLSRFRDVAPRVVPATPGPFAYSNYTRKARRYGDNWCFPC